VLCCGRVLPFFFPSLLPFSFFSPSLGEKHISWCPASYLARIDPSLSLDRDFPLSFFCLCCCEWMKNSSSRAFSHSRMPTDFTCSRVRMFGSQEQRLRPRCDNEILFSPPICSPFSLMYMTLQVPNLCLRSFCLDGQLEIPFETDPPRVFVSPVVSSNRFFFFIPLFLPLSFPTLSERRQEVS